MFCPPPFPRSSIPSYPCSCDNMSGDRISIEKDKTRVWMGMASFDFNFARNQKRMSDHPIVPADMMMSFTAAPKPMLSTKLICGFQAAYIQKILDIGLKCSPIAIHRAMLTC